MPESIPCEVAKEMCARLREERGRKFFTQCWGCVRFSGGDFARMCASSRPDFRGCSLINKEFDRDGP